MRYLVNITTKTTGEVGAVQKLDLKMTFQVRSFQIVARPQAHGISTQSYVRYIQARSFNI
jgi:hypothetical protein